MICICYQRQLELLARFAHLPANAGSGLALPADLLPKVGALNGSLTNASSALSAAPAANVAASPALGASPQASGAASISANPQLAAAAQLSALAGATSGLKASLGIDLNSPGAGEACAQAWAMIPSFMQTLAALPLHLEPKLAELAKVGELSDKLKDQLDVDLQSPAWVSELSDSVVDKVADVQKAAQDAVDDAAASAADAAGSLVPAVPKLPGGGSLAVSESASPAESLMAAPATSVQTGMGVDLSAPGGVDALGVKLAALKPTVGAMPASMAPVDSALILATMQMLVTIDTLRRTLGIDVLAPGAGAGAQPLLASLSSNLAAAPAACAALDNAAGAASALSGGASGGSSSAGGGAALGGSGSGSGGASLGASSSSSASASSGASSAAGAASPLANPALAQLMAGMPGVPVPWVLLTALCAQVKATLGIQLIAHGPCG